MRVRAWVAASIKWTVSSVPVWFLADLAKSNLGTNLIKHGKQETLGSSPGSSPGLATFFFYPGDILLFCQHNQCISYARCSVTLVLTM